MNKPKVYIDGKEGTTGLQIYDRLAAREDIQLLLIDEDKRKDAAERKKFLNAADLVFLCLPDAAAVEAVSLIDNDRTRVIDCSTAHRTNPDWVYGFPELKKEQREAISAAKRVANPGCHATGFLACVAPLRQVGAIQPDYPLTCWSLTGYSGGGKKMIAEYEDPGRDPLLAGPAPYSLGMKHKHLPEMQKIAGLDYPPAFLPVLGDVYKGMCTTVMLHNTHLGKHLEAEEIYDAVLALRSGEKDAYFLRGNVRMALDDYEGAKADFEKVISMDPKNYDRLIEIFEVMDYFGHGEEGREYLRAALDAGDTGMDQYARGRIHYYLGDYQSACLALEEAREKGGVESYLYLGRAYEATGDYNYAANVYNSYLEKNEGNAELYNQLGLCEMTRGEYRNALGAFQAGMQLENTTMMQTLSFNEIVAYEYLGEYMQAHVLMENYLKNYPDDEQAKREYKFLSTR